MRAESATMEARLAALIDEAERLPPNDPHRKRLDEMIGMLRTEIAIRHRQQTRSAPGDAAS